MKPKAKTKVQMWYQPTNVLYDDYTVSPDSGRLRILSDKGEAYYDRFDTEYDTFDYLITACWAHGRDFKNLKDLERAMRAYDVQQGFPPAVLIGEWYE